MANVKTKEEMALIAKLHEIIPRVGVITDVHLKNAIDMLDYGIWSIEDMTLWAQHFVNDPWRQENKQYCTINHFLRDPEKWSEEVKKREEKEWNLKSIKLDSKPE